MPDFQDWREYQQRVAKENTPDPRHAHVAAIVGEKLERLLNGDEWDALKVHLETLVTADDQGLAMLREQMDQGLLVGDDLARANLRIQRLLGRLEARREDLALPATVLKQLDKPVPDGVTA